MKRPLARPARRPARPHPLTARTLPPLLGLCALLAASFPAQADNEGGAWYPSMDASCSSGSPGQDYKGGCQPQSSLDEIKDKKVTINTNTASAAGAMHYGAGDVTNNQIDISAGAAAATINEIIGGYSYSGTLVKQNRVTIQATPNLLTITREIIGGSARAADASVIGNTVSIQGSDKTVFSANIIGGSATGSNSIVAQNTVSITGGKFESGSNIAGGFSFSPGIRASENTVSITGGTFNAPIWGAWATGNNSFVTGNTVSITGGTFKQEVGGAQGGANATVSNNTVSISGGKFHSYIVSNQQATSSSANNRIILSGAPDLSESSLIGSNTAEAGVRKSKGNILEIRTTGLQARDVWNFEEFHFILPATTQANDTVLTVTGAGSGSTSLKGSKVGVAMAGGGNVLRTGDKIILIHSSYGLETDAAILSADMTGYQGISLQYTFDVSADAKNLYATVASVPSGGGATVMAQTKAPVEGRASTMALASQGADLAGGAGMARAVAATEGASGTATFGATAGGSSRYHSGSHVDVDGLSVMIGAARRYPAATNQWLAGVFLEGGYGSYDTYNDFAGQPTVRGHGKSHYVGGGVLLRLDWAGAGQAGPYAEGSLRVGRVSSDWRSGDMRGSRDASYDTSVMYYGAHLGGGYLLPLNEKTSLDLHAKGFWTHQGSDSVTIAGDPYEFKTMDSFRTRLGLRLNRDLTEQITAYAGAAWEHEFDGKARATTYGLDTPSPSLQGDTGVFELGFDMKPKANGPLTVGLGVQAYTGMREGFGGTAKLMWVF